MLSAIVLGNNVTNIGTCAFGWCYGLGGITIPASVTSIGYLAFEQCFSLTAITVDDANEVYSSVDGVLYDSSATTLLVFPPGKTNNFAIPSGVTGVGNGAFYYCAGLTNVTIPESVTSIGSEAFYECSGLKRMGIPDAVTTIGYSAFSYSGLISVTIGSDVTNIESYAFDNCNNLTGVYFLGNAPGHSGGFYSGNLVAVYYLPGTTGWDEWAGPPAAVLWNPRALTGDASFGVQANQFGFTIAGSSNLVIVVEACTNLSNPIWLLVGTNTLDTFIGTNGTSYFSDPQWTNYPIRYYRFRSP